MEMPAVISKLLEEHSDRLKARRPVFVPSPEVRARNAGRQLRALPPKSAYECVKYNGEPACAICLEPGWRSKKGLVRDHSHATGKARALLCGRCNQALGLLNDDPALVFRALEYLKSY